MQYCVNMQFCLILKGDNIQTAVSVARQCGILSNEEYIANITMISGEKKEDRPKIHLDIQNLQSAVNNAVNSFN